MVKVLDIDKDDREHRARGRHRQVGQTGGIIIATNMAGRDTDIKLGRTAAGRGGLHVIATERHESGRIDWQLFGRCARQCDLGSARAFMSIEDGIIERFLPLLVRKNLAWAITQKSPGRPAHFVHPQAV